MLISIPSIFKSGEAYLLSLLVYFYFLYLYYTLFFFSAVNLRLKCSLEVDKG